MQANGVSLSKAELLSVILEAILYGLSLLVFGVTIWVLSLRQSDHQAKHKMTLIVFVLLTLSTTHLVIHIIKIVQGFLLYEDDFPGGANAFFGDASQWTFHGTNGVYVAQSLVGNAVVLYRCYAMWKSKLVMAFPLLLWFAAFGFNAVYMQSKMQEGNIFSEGLAQWITSWWAMSLSSNLVATGLLAWRLWSTDTDRETRNCSVKRTSQLHPILRVILDAGLIYSVTLLAALAFFIRGDDIGYVAVNLVTPIISITFYMVVIRACLANSTNLVINLFVPECISLATFDAKPGDMTELTEVDAGILTESEAGEQ